MVNSTQTGDKAYCRGFSYYVNPDSPEVVELGSKEYPYKSLSLVFVEILNYMSNLELSINIYLMANSTNYLQNNHNFLVNMTSVSISTYSPYEEVGKASLVLKEEAVDTISEKTKFSLIKDAGLSTSIISDASVAMVEDDDKIIAVYKTNFSMENLEITSEYAEISSNHAMIYAYEQQDNQVTLKNLDIKISGGLLLTFDPIIVIGENLHID